ncbi:hypothetical protein FRC06_006150 [Ceratobasidium sp. 370]|nr:hypothetical protein FRC06_006150 [Ceratobasidium sp. 370]
MKLSVKAASAHEYDWLDGIKADEITDQVIQPLSLRPPSPLDELGIAIEHPDEDKKNTVTFSRRSGRVGSTLVTYITYSSAGAATAQTRVKEDLRWMSQFLFIRVMPLSWECRKALG